jgi:branched-chain amino acid aminotransferase
MFLPSSTPCLYFSLASNELILPCIKVKYDELSKFDEVLAVGTAALVVPIKSITRKTASETFSYVCGKDGNTCFKILFDKVLDAQTGRYAPNFSWSYIVKEPSSYGINEL